MQIDRQRPHLLHPAPPGPVGSNPYWKGQDTGLASCRSKVFEGLPTAGVPYQLSGWDQFEQLMDTLISARTIHSIREVWWDIRPHPSFGTVELRIGDGLPTMQEVSTVAAMSQCLVDRFNTLIDRGYTLPVPRGWIVREVVAAGGTPMDVVDSLVEELRSDRFSPVPNPTLP